MKIPEPNRLLDESNSQLERALLGAGAVSPSSAQTRAKTMAALGLAAGSATLLTGAAGAASLTSAAKLTWTKLVLGVSLAGAAAVPVGYYVAKHQPAAESAAARPAAARAHAAAPGGDGESVEDMLEAPVVLPADPVARASLTRELAALDRARLTLAHGDARGALGQLEAYQRSFPRGRLAVEAEVLRIDALAKMGRSVEARQHAQSFLRLHPNSVLATRVRAHLD